MNALPPFPATDDASSIGTGSADTEAAMARALVQRLRTAGRQSTAEMLH